MFVGWHTCSFQGALMTPMNQLYSVFILLFSFNLCSSLRILIIVPGISNSHVMFNYRLAQMLTNAGHNVTLLNFVMEFNGVVVSNPPSGVKEIRFKPDFFEEVAKSYIVGFQSTVFKSDGLVQRIPMLQVYYDLFVKACEQFVDTDEEFVEKYRNNFDLTLSHFFTFCPVGISRKLEVPKFVWIASGTYITEFAASKIGLPILGSFVPQYSMPYSDAMTFSERIFNVIRITFNEIASQLLLTVGNGSEWNSFSKFPEEEFPDLFLLLQNTLALFINGESFLDFPRPLLPNVFYMGDVEQKQRKKLNDPRNIVNYIQGLVLISFQEWQNFMDGARDGVIIFSLGTLANTSTMPMELKQAFMDAFAKFPTYSFVWRLEGEMPVGLDEQKHIKIVKWIPQRDLLHHPKLKLFITHGGYNSLLELAQAGIPMIVMPLFGDQTGNAFRAVRNGLGLVVDKFTTDPDVIADSIRQILTNDTFHTNSLKFSSMLHDKLISNEIATVRLIEKIARVQQWPLSKPLQKLNLFQYYCADILLLFVTCVFFVIFVSIRVIRKCSKIFLK